MPFCPSCGKEISENVSFCSNCGAKVLVGSTAETKDSTGKSFQIKSKHIILGIIVVIVLFSIAVFLFKDRVLVPYIVKGPQEAQECPFDCCIYGDYKIKQCEADFECFNNKCKAIDSDNDGLTDIEERQQGTNVNYFDTDGDGLSDYIEVKVEHTNPLNKNTDGDRYDDGEDNEPLIKNSAIIKVDVTHKDWEWELFGILDLLENLKKFEPDFTLATAKVDIIITNTGDDYTEYVRFDNVFKIQRVEVMRIPESIGILNEGEQVSKHYEYKFTAKQAPNAIWNAIKSKTTEWSFEVFNVVYEKF